MSSIKSTALEPTAVELQGLSLSQKAWRLAPVYGLPIFTLILIVLFSILLPNTFPTMLNLRSILGDKAIIAMLSLAAMIPMMAGRIDLTVGYGIVLWHVLAIALWYTEGRQVIGVLPRGFTELYTLQPFGIPIAAYYVLVLSLVLWIVTEYLPVGRYLYAIGANPRAAALNGIPSRRFVIGAFVASGFLGAVAGIVLAARLRIGQASVGLEFLLPALVGAFLGSTTIRPGRVNVWGTIIGVSILAVGISGIQQMGGEFYVEPLFNGVTLLIAIGLAGYAQRKRGQVRHVRPAAAPPPSERPPA